MRELHGVTTFLDTNLKRHLLLFDKLYVHGADANLSLGHRSQLVADLSFLKSRGLMRDLPDDVFSHQYDVEIERFMGTSGPIDRPEQIGMLMDAVVRIASASLPQTDCDVVSICQNELPELWPQAESSGPSQTTSLAQTLHVTLQALPVPDDVTSLEDVLNFREALKEKQWGLRRFLRALATKKQTDSEIRDEIEWMVNEYTKAMAIHHIKASQSFFEVYVLPVIEIAEDLAKFNWSKIAKGALDVKKRKIELLEAEMKAPGRECAYVFDARKRFGKS